MDRREAIASVCFILGGTVVGAGSYLSGCKPKNRKPIFGILDNRQIKTLEELAETILPKSNESPGAKDAEIGKFFNRFVTDCYNSDEQKTFQDGISQLDEMSSLSFNENFVDLNSEQRNTLLFVLENDAKVYNKSIKSGVHQHYYSMIKQVAILGYLTSEIVGTKVFRHVPIPGRFEGCIPYKQGEKAFI